MTDDFHRNAVFTASYRIKYGVLEIAFVLNHRRVYLFLFWK